MPHVTSDDGVRLSYEEAGAGHPVVFVHEFAGDYRSYETQLRYFSRRYRCIAFNARGYPPSDVPEDFHRYSQERARDDIRAVLDGLKIEKAHIVGISMGGFAVLHFGLAYPERASALVVAGCGYGAQPDKRQQFQEETARTAAQIESAGMAEVSKSYGAGPTRVQYLNKDPRGYAEFLRPLAAPRSALGHRLDLGDVSSGRGKINRRPYVATAGVQPERRAASAAIARLRRTRRHGNASRSIGARSRRSTSTRIWRRTRASSCRASIRIC